MERRRVEPNNELHSLQDIADVISQLIPEELERVHAQYLDEIIRVSQEKRRIIECERQLVAREFNVNYTLSLIEAQLQQRTEAAVDKTD